MAKLSSNGEELVRVQKMRQGEPHEDMEWLRTERALMSNGWILKKFTMRFKASAYGPARTHSDGWKRWQKVKLSVTPEIFIATHVQGGWEVV